MKVVIRADASAVIGSGHVARCLCLANALADSGAEVHFVTRNLPAHLERQVLDDGHQVSQLPPVETRETLLPADTCWPEALQLRDAQDTVRMAHDLAPCDWFVVDHYGLSAPWEAAVRGVARMMSIDDLARPHQCNLLLDQNVYPDPASRYAGLVPRSCESLIGPAYALLRPEFARARAGLLPRKGDVRRLLLFFGGMDSANATGIAIDALIHLGLRELPVDIVIGSIHPLRPKIADLGMLLPGSKFHVQTRDMAGLCASADLAIGAAGSSTWERCCLGLPALVLVVAENQREIALNADRAGLVCNAGGLPDAASLAIQLRALLDDEPRRTALSRNGMLAVDGLGASRVARKMYQS